MNYYGVTRSADHLAHYGVKGMRWGVRRAKDKLIVGENTSKKLDRKYKKAYKKLEVLNHRANVDAQKKEAALYKPSVGAGLAVGAAGLAGLGYHLPKSIQKPPVTTIVKEYGKAPAIVREGFGNFNATVGSAIVTGVGLGTALGSGIRYKQAKNRTTVKGHAKAVAKRNEWRNAMGEVFSGTKYANFPKPQSKKKRRK